MTWWQAIILGLVEGVTEYLPISSTGHLLLAQRAMSIPSGEAADAFAICIQLGAILAVLGLYSGRVRSMLRGLAGRDHAGRSLLINLAAAFLPAAVLGIALEKLIKNYLFGGKEWGLWPIVAAWFVGGVAILVIARQRRGIPPDQGASIENLTPRMALIIGLAQCLAMWPGVSRSLATILGGLLVGMSMRSAVEFSFLLGVITLSAATAKDALDYGPLMLQEYGAINLALGLLFAWVSAAAAIKWMVGYLSRHGLEIFGYYRIALALVVTALILLGILIV